MPELIFETRLRCSVQALWDFHASAEALKVLTPPGRQVEVTGEDLRVVNGALHVLRLKQFGVPIEWRARISDVTPPTGFTDTAEKSPFRSWVHRHDFLPDGDGAILRDTVRYEPPFGPLGSLANALFIRRDLEQMFAYRHQATRRAVEGS